MRSVRHVGASRVRLSVCSLLGAAALATSGCHASGAPRGAWTEQCEQPFRAPTREEDLGLRINEVVSANDGAAVDEHGETDDFVELVNTGASALSLRGLYLADANNSAPLPDITLEPEERVVLWADDQVSQGSLHMPFKLDRKGEELSLWRGGCVRIDRLAVPALADNESYARFPDAQGEPARCRYASAGRGNGEGCEPPAPPELPDDVSFEPYTWPERWPESQGPLVIRALKLAPNAQVELSNRSDAPVQLDRMSLRIAASAPGVTWPTASEGTEVDMPDVLAAGESVLLAMDASVLSGSATREGVLTLFADEGERVLDRVDFTSLPDGAWLARDLADPRLYRVCSTYSRGACEPLPDRSTGDRLRALHTPTDFAQLARGGTEVGNSAVKFVLDMQAGDVVHLLANARWALHYTFVREQILHEPALDRCDPLQNLSFYQGWYAFSEREYFRVEGRRFLLGTLVRYANGLNTVEFAVGDAISPEQMRRAFFAAVQRTEDPRAWALRPQDATQAQRMLELSGQLPIVGVNAPFRDLVYQPLTTAVGYGTLRFVPARELEQAALGQNTIVITDDVPNDIPFVGGLITEAFQAPLAHVNVLSEARGTPNMALRHAHEDPRIVPLLDKLVRLEVGTGSFELRAASAEEAAAFYESRAAQGPRRAPEHDDELRGVQLLEAHGIASARSIGSKAAQLAELAHVTQPAQGCPASSVPLRTPAAALAIPFAHYLDHFQASGAEARLSELLADPAFRTDARVRSAGLAELRRRILEHPVDSALNAEVEAAILARFGEAELRFRSSSNMEDLDTFNGAGLHTSSSASAAPHAEISLDEALRIVWASLWNERAYDEREAGHLEQTAARMGVLIHERYDGEAAQGVAISRNLLDVTRSDMYYIDAQHGEASVTNPAPGVSTEQLVYSWRRSPEVVYHSRSSLRPEAVLSLEETRELACALAAVHAHFRPLLDQEAKNRTFAMQVEWKLLPGSRAVAIKQARPQPFGSVDVPKDCREF